MVDAESLVPGTVYDPSGLVIVERETVGSVPDSAEMRPCPIPPHWDVIGMEGACGGGTISVMRMFLVMMMSRTWNA